MLGERMNRWRSGHSFASDNAYVIRFSSNEWDSLELFTCVSLLGFRLLLLSCFRIEPTEP